MRNNERGSTFVLVLIIILVFSVIGVSLMGSSISERKRVDTIEVDGQARVLAQSGLTYFESQFEKFIENSPELMTADYLFNFFDSFSEDPAPIPLEGVKLGVERDGFEIAVTSEGTVNSKTKTVKGHYRIGFDIDKPTYEIADFTAEGTVSVNFADEKVLGLNLGLLGLGLLNPTGLDQKFYEVPADEIVSVRLLGPVLGLGLGGDDFKTYAERGVIATRAFTVLGLDLLGGTLSKLVSIDVLSLRHNEDTNVVINGSANVLELLGMKINNYSDIEFKKFAVIGNTLIQQDRDGSGLISTKDNKERRRFTFDEGLYVNRSLIIGGEQDRVGKANEWKDFSQLMLRGDMVAMDNLGIYYVDLIFGDKDDKESAFNDEDYVSNLYVHGDVHIHDACIRPKNIKYEFGIYTKGKLTLENYTNQTGCNQYNGVFYAEDGIEIKTHGKNMYINGGLIGNVKVDYPEKLHYNPSPAYMTKLKNIKLNFRETVDD